MNDLLLIIGVSIFVLIGGALNFGRINAIANLDTENESEIVLLLSSVIIIGFSWLMFIILFGSYFFEDSNKRKFFQFRNSPILKSWKNL